MPITRNTAFQLLAYCILLVLSVWVFIGESRVFEMPYLTEDQYITATYARSIANGYGFRAHPDAETSLGTSTPLFALIFAAIAKVVPENTDLRYIPVIISTLAWIATAWLWALKGHILGISRVSSAGVSIIMMLLLAGSDQWVTKIAFEMALFCCLSTLAIFAYFARRYFIAGVVLALGVLTRPEGLVIILALGLFELLRLIYDINTEKSLKQVPITLRAGLITGAGLLAVTAIWVIFASASIGYLFPSTVAAKNVQGQSGNWPSASQMLLNTVFFTTSALGPGSQEIFRMSLLGLFAIAGSYATALFARKALIFTLIIFLQIILYSIFKAPAYDWYELPILYLTVINAAFAFTVLPEGLAKLAAQKTSLRAIRLAAPIILTALITFLVVKIVPQAFQAELEPFENKDYMLLSDWLHANSAPDASVAAVEVGHLVWFSGRHILDLLGLMSPEVLPYFAGGLNNPAIIENLQPEYYIEIDVISAHLKLDRQFTSAFFRENYIPVAQMFGLGIRSEVLYTIYKKSQPPIARDSDLEIAFDQPGMTFSGFAADAAINGGALSARSAGTAELIGSDLRICASDFDYIHIQVRSLSNSTVETLRMSFTADGAVDTTGQGSATLKYRADDTWHTLVIPTSMIGAGWGPLDDPYEDLSQPAYPWQGIITSLTLSPLSSDATDFQIRNWRLLRKSPSADSTC